VNDPLYAVTENNNSNNNIMLKNYKMKIVSEREKNYNNWKGTYEAICMNYRERIKIIIFN
jgi:hypothetical protein